MPWRADQQSYRQSLLDRNTDADAERYHGMVGHPAQDAEEAHRNDIRDVFALRPGEIVLEPGAGTGVFSRLLLSLEPLALTVLEPSPSMLRLLQQERALQGVTVQQGFSDSREDCDQFPAGHFDVIANRAVVNALYDPITAFRNWHHWLKPDGRLLVIDGLFQPSAWTGVWQQDVNVLPMSACQTPSMIPYLLETAGFAIQHVGPMRRVNALPTTRAPRSIVVAVKNSP